MSNGRVWTQEHTNTLERMKGKPDADVARVTGHSVRTIREHRRAAGISAYIGRARWTRRDWLLHDAAGLDFQMSLCR